MLRNSFVELRARERAFALVKSGVEIIDPFEMMISPHLEPQGIVPESDDGIVVVRGKMEDKEITVISIEGAFQGGGIGEVSGAKIVAALEKVLEENKQGNYNYPVIILDTGGVRLQEANYGLLSISEIGNMIIALKEFVPVIGLVPGLVGSFGGMSITSALMSYLIATKKARVGLNGPEVIEQEAGVQEFDASDKSLIWETIGANQRKNAGVIDEVVVDEISEIRNSILSAINENKNAKRTEKANFYLSLFEKLDLSRPLDIEEYNKIFLNHVELPVEILEATAGNTPLSDSVGYQWFEKITQCKNPQTKTKTVLHKSFNLANEEAVAIAIVTDRDNSMYRVRNGEVGLVEGFTVSKIIEQIIIEDSSKEVKRPIVCIIDVPSQAYGYNEELIGIHISLASSASYYAKARQAGHPVVGLIVGNAISGAFLAHGLQSNRLIALNDPDLSVQAMSKESAARITNRTLEELEAATKKVPAMAYDIVNFSKLGALYKLVDGVVGKNPTDSIIEKLIGYVDDAVSDIREKNDTMLSYRYTNKQATNFGRVATLKMRDKMSKKW